MLYPCPICGAVVMHRGLHVQWHLGKGDDPGKPCLTCGHSSFLHDGECDGAVASPLGGIAGCGCEKYREPA